MPSQSPHAAVHSYGIVASVVSSCSGCDALSMPLGEERRSTEQSKSDDVDVASHWCGSATR